MKSAVLFIVFNRPETTARVFEAIRQARPPRLYIAADGPRAQRPADAERCAEVRRIVSGVDWDCEVRTLFREENLGCRRGVSSGIDWFFGQEEEGIILEDDCLPATSFFPYCDELLARYRNDERIFQISGSNFVGAAAAQGKSYYFTNYPDIWGWATWRRSWRHYDVTMRDWPAARRRGDITRVSYGRRAVDNHWIAVFDNTWRGNVDTWDFQWLFACWQAGGLNIMPAVNQIENLGYGSDATHTIHEKPDFLLKAGELPFPLDHPERVATSVAVDAMITRKRFDITAFQPVRDALRNFPVVGALLTAAKRAISATLK